MKACFKLGMAVSTFLLAFSAHAKTMTGEINMMIIDYDEEDRVEQMTLFTESESGKEYLLKNADFDAMLNQFYSGEKVQIDADLVSEDTINMNSIHSIDTQKTSGNENATVRKVGFFAVNVIVPTDAENNLTDEELYDWKSSMINMKKQVEDFYDKTTYGNVSMPTDANGNGEPDVYGMYTYTASTRACQPSKYREAANEQAQAQGIKIGEYNTRAYLIYGNTSCGWGGSSFVNCNNCNAFIKNKIRRIFAHEIGHNLGFKHSGTDPNDRLVIQSAYGDSSSPMGRGNASWNAPNMLQMNWLESKYIEDITTGGTFILSHLRAEACCSNTKVIRIPRADGNNFYTISYREKQEMDSTLAATYVNKVFVHSHAGGVNPSRLIKVLDVGQSWTANDGSKMVVKYLSRADGEAVVEIVR